MPILPIKLSLLCTVYVGLSLYLRCANFPKSQMCELPYETAFSSCIQVPMRQIHTTALLLPRNGGRSGIRHLTSSFLSRLAVFYVAVESRSVMNLCFGVYFKNNTRKML